MKTKPLFLFVILLFTQCTYAFDFFSTSKCKLSNGINIITSKHILTICSNNQVVKEFDVSLGRRGVGKKLRGDKKTPLGLYELESPRKSNRYGIFIPIKYPTHEQRLAGFTGSDVGIHGPIQRYTWFTSFNWANTAIDWTFGCIAVADNAKINYIADWIARHPSAKVLIS